MNYGSCLALPLHQLCYLYLLPGYANGRMWNLLVLKVAEANISAKKGDDDGHIIV